MLQHDFLNPEEICCCQAILLNVLNLIPHTGDRFPIIRKAVRLESNKNAILFPWAHDNGFFVIFSLFSSLSVFFIPVKIIIKIKLQKNTFRKYNLALSVAF